MIGHLNVAQCSGDADRNGQSIGRRIVANNSANQGPILEVGAESLAIVFTAKWNDGAVN